MTPLLRRDGHALIVAEIGNNHEGSLAVALELIARAAEVGADAVKFQTFRTDLFVSPADIARYARLKRFELAPADFTRLAGATHAAGLLFLSTPLDLDSVAVLEPLVDAFKIASGDLTFTPLLRRVAVSGRPVILSTGASELAEIRAAISVLRECWRERGVTPVPELAVLHCISCYPVADDQASIGAIEHLKRQLNVPIGYSDHTLGGDAAVFAAAFGACIVEKHFTLDKAYSDFRDHTMSADPAELRTIVEKVRKLETMRGSGVKAVQPCEQPMREAIRRSIVAAADLREGHVLRMQDLTWMRPGTGLGPGREADLIGRTLTRAVARGQTVTLADAG